jgi:hypothetical protein
MIEFIHNMRPHAGRKHTPCELIMGYNPKAFISEEETNIPSINEKSLFLDQTCQAVLEAHEQTQQKMAKQKNHIWNPFKVGDQVWLDNRNLPLPYLSKKPSLLSHLLPSSSDFG